MKRMEQIWSRIGLLLALGLALIQALSPIVWMVFGSLKAGSDFYERPWGLPSEIVVRNYTAALETPGIGSGLWNSVTVVLLGISLLAVTAGTTAYALARFEFAGKTWVLGLILLTMMIPPEVLTVPLFFTLKSLGILGTLPGLACLYASGSFGMSVFLLRGYFEAIPVAIEEAALIDGIGFTRVLTRIVVPLAWPGFVNVLAIQAMGMWNDLYLSLVFVTDPRLATAPVGLLSFFQRDSIDWPLLLAALCSLTLPVLLVFAMLQRRIVGGLMAGAVK